MGKVSDEDFERLSLVARYTHSSMTFADEDGLLEWVNPAFTKLTGYSLDDVKGKRAIDVLTGAGTDPEIIAEIEGAISKGEAYDVELLNYRKDGTKLWVSTDIRPIKDGQGKVCGFIGNQKDISKRKRSEEELIRVNKDLEEQRKALEESNDELRQFAYVASHDLQEPLRTISNFIELIDKRYTSKLDDDGKEFIAYVLDGSQHMRLLIDNLLQYSRIGTSNVEFSSVDMNEVFHQALINQKLVVEEKSATVTSDDLPMVHGDHVQLVQLLQNLIANGIKFSDSDDIQVSVTCSESEEASETKYYRFAVKDNGIGIRSEYQDKIFEIFQRLHSRSEYEGTGVGLALCKRIVSRHGGQIWVDSDEGKGATFYFTLPEA